MSRYFEELARRFPEGFEVGAELANATTVFNPPQGIFLLATQAGAAVGCGALQWIAAPPQDPAVAPHGTRTAEIKRMWVHPAARGHGLGRRLLLTLEGYARRGKATRAVLDTHGELREAIALYRSAGYQPIDRYNDNPYAHHFFAKDLQAPNTLQQRRAHQGDWERIVVLNNSEVPHVGPLRADQGPWFIDQATITTLESGGPSPELVAMVVAMTDGCGYTSPNYTWFTSRYRAFAYIDRIVVRADHTGAGIARRLYDEVAAAARLAGKPVLFAEVNLDPPNERSRHFHQRYGFVEVGRQVDPRTNHTLTMLALTLT